MWIRGLFLEGAGWDKKSSCLIEADPMQLVCGMPTIHFKPVEGKRRSAKGIVSLCLVYTKRYPKVHGNEYYCCYRNLSLTLLLLP